MTTMRAPSAPARPCGFGPTTRRKPPFAARRRLLILCCLLMLAVVAVAANYGPVRHYRDARARLEKTTAEVAVLEQRKAALQSRLADLGQAGYLEGLARQELSYARPDEDLYIVTGLPDADDSTASVDGAGRAVAPPTRDALGGSTNAGGAPTGRVGHPAGGPSAGSAGTGIGVSGSAAETMDGLGIGATWIGGDESGPYGAGRPGFFERLLSAIARVF